MLETRNSELTSVASDDSKTTNPIVAQWQLLASMDQQSPDFLPLLSSLTDKGNRTPTTELCGSDAEVALDAMDQVSTNGGIAGGGTLKTMRELAHNSGLVPTRYQVDQTSLSVEVDAIASGSSTKVQGGRLGGMAVTVRIFRVDQKAEGNNFRRLFCKECVLWMDLSHPNILRPIGVDIDSQTGRYSVISEMMSRNIKEYIRDNSTNRHRLLRDAAAGLCYLHQRGIVHGGLAGNNILITGDTPPRVCLADFGLSSLAPSTDGTANAITPNSMLLYMAPELLSPASFRRLSATPTKPADIYALGMVIYEVLTGLQPFCDGDYPSIDQIVKGERPKRPQDAEQVFVNGTWELVEECWAKHSMKRPTVERVRECLTGAAGSSMEIGPTPEVSRNFSEPGRAAQTSDSATTTTQCRTTSSGNLTAPTDGVITVHRTASPANSVNPTNSRSSHLARLEERDHGYHPPGTGNPPLTDSNHHSIPMDSQTILMQWRSLKCTGPTDDVQLSPLVDVPENRRITLKFKGKHAITVINAIDKVLKEPGVSEPTKSNACRTLRRLAESTCQVPDSYLVGRWTRFTVEIPVMANGGEADVRQGKLRDTVVAVKTFRTSKETNVDHMHKAFCKESVLWMNVCHPNVLKLLAVDINPRKRKFSMISEMMPNGNIMRYIRTNKADLPGLLKDVARGLQYLHEAGIIHGDIKGANILIDSHSPPSACIADFGLCNFLPSTSFDPTAKKTVRGTPGYMAPELYRRNGEHTKATDMYAFGTVIREVITGTPMARRRGVAPQPCPSEAPEDLGNRGFDQESWEFMKRCRDEDPEERPMAEEALEHFERIAVTQTFIDPIANSLDSEMAPSLGSSGSRVDDPPPSRFCCYI